MVKGLKLKLSRESRILYGQIRVTLKLLNKKPPISIYLLNPTNPDSLALKFSSGVTLWKMGNQLWYVPEEGNTYTTKNLTNETLARELVKLIQKL